MASLFHSLVKNITNCTNNIKQIGANISNSPLANDLKGVKDQVQSAAKVYKTAKVLVTGITVQNSDGLTAIIQNIPTFANNYDAFAKAFDDFFNSDKTAGHTNILESFAVNNFGQDTFDFFSKLKNNSAASANFISSSQTLFSTAIKDIKDKDLTAFFTNFDNNYDTWAAAANKLYDLLTPQSQSNILETLAIANFGTEVFNTGSVIKNETPNILNGIKGFKSGIDAFGGSYRNPVEAVKKIQTGVDQIVKSTEQLSKSINTFVKLVQSRGTMNNAPGLAPLNALSNLSSNKVVKGAQQVLKGASIAANAASKASNIAGNTSNLVSSVKKGDIKGAIASGKSIADDVKAIVKGTTVSAKNTSAASSLSSGSASSATTSSATTSSATTSSTTPDSGSSSPASTQDKVTNTSDETQGKPENSESEESKGGRDADSYVCSGATMKCSFGMAPAKLTVYPNRTVFLTGQPMANITDHISKYNIAAFGRCRTTSFPATGAATAAAHGKLTPMPCIPGTLSNWINGKSDVLVKGNPALLKSSYCKCCWGGIITITNDGQGKTSVVVGAQECPVKEYEDLTCSIVKIKARYSKYKDKKIDREIAFDLFDQLTQKDTHKEEQNQGNTEFTKIQSDSLGQTSIPNEEELAIPEDGVLKCSISYDVYDTFRHLYFISDYRGRQLNLSANRIENHCKDANHNKYFVEYVDIKDHSLKETSGDISSAKINLYYYNFFESSLVDCLIPYGNITRGISQTIGMFRFIHLPEIKEDDYANESHAIVYFHDCMPHNVPPFYIHVYPDIEYSFKIEVAKVEKKWNFKDMSIEKEQNPFSLEFTVETGGDKRELSLSTEISDTDDITVQQAKKVLKAIKMLADFVIGLYNFTNDLINFFSGKKKSKKKSSNTKNKKEGNDSVEASFSLSWLEGSIKLAPNIKFTWNYAVSDDLTELKRRLKLELGGSGEGELIIDLIEISFLAVKTAKDASAVAATTSGPFTFGVGFLVGLLIKLLGDPLVKWLLNKLKDKFHFDVVLRLETDIPAFSYDTAEEQPFDGGIIEFTLTFGLRLGLEYKSSIAVNSSIIPFSPISEVEWEAKAMAEASIAAIININFYVRNKNFGAKWGLDVDPFKIKLEIVVIGHFKRKSSNKKASKDSKSKKSSDSLFGLNSGMTKEYNFGGWHLIEDKQLFNFGKG